MCFGPGSVFNWGRANRTASNNQFCDAVNRIIQQKKEHMERGQNAEEMTWTTPDTRGITKIEKTKKKKQNSTFVIEQRDTKNKNRNKKNSSLLHRRPRNSEPIFFSSRYATVSGSSYASDRSLIDDRLPKNSEPIRLPVNWMN